MGPMDDNDRVNRMNEQEFADHMNELFLRDNKNPLKQGFLSQLPSSRYQKSAEENKERSEEDNCSICQMDYENDDELVTLTCFHKFHIACVE